MIREIARCRVSLARLRSSAASGRTIAGDDSSERETVGLHGKSPIATRSEIKERGESERGRARYDETHTENAERTGAGREINR